MRVIPETLAAKLAGGVTTLAHVWLITRRDGEVLGFTDHDNALTFDGHLCEPATGLVAGAVEKALGLSVDTASLSGALSSEKISAEDIAKGLWDGARVALYKIDWADPTASVFLFSGKLGEVKRGAHAFVAELRGPQAALNIPVGRVFARFCDADFGDARCGADADDPAFRASCNVSAIVDTRSFRTGDLSAFADGWFTRGRLIWASGGEGEVAVHRREGADAFIELLDSAGPALTLGAAFEIVAGCDKRFETCRIKFANALNFRGFPYMPGNDAMQAGPQAGAALDGASRYT
jgi:uncharacterized phage protein (TIGR02218 family)